MYGIGNIENKLRLTTSINGLGLVPPMKSKAGNAFILDYVPISEIYTDEKNFQNRTDKYSEKSVDAIIKAVKNGAFNWFAFDPVLLWRNPDGQLIVLSGHSRTEAFRRLSQEKPQIIIDGLSFNRIPAKIFEGDFLSAKNLALNSNALSTPETLLERADFYRKQRAQITSARAIKDLREKALRENQGNVIWDLSFLPPDGLSYDFLKRFKLQEDSESAFENYIRAVNIAQWIGKAFQIYKGLSNLHDSELFRFLVKNYGNKSGQYNSFAKLNDRLSVLYPRNVKNDKKVDANGKYTNAFGLSIFEKNDDEIAELDELKKLSDSSKRELNSKIKDLRGRTDDKEKVFSIVTPYFNQYINHLFDYWQGLDRERKRYEDKNQAALFGLGKPTIKFEFDTNSELADFLSNKKQSYQYAENVTVNSNNSKSKSTAQKKITSSSYRQLPLSSDNPQLPPSDSPKTLPPSGSPKALPPAYANIYEAELSPGFRESLNTLQNSGMIPVTDIISIIEKNPSQIFWSAGTNGILKLKFKENDWGTYYFNVVDDSGNPIPGEVAIPFTLSDIERLNTELKSFFIEPERTTPERTTPKLTSTDLEDAAKLKALLEPTTAKDTSPDWDAIYKRLVDSHQWNSFDPESAAEYDVKIFRNAYNNVIAELPENRKADFTLKFIAKVYEIARLNAAAPSAAVTGRGGITAKKAAKYNAANDRYMQARADFSEWLNNYAERAAKIEERERKAAMNVEERRDERFEVIKKNIDYFSALLKNREQVPSYSISNARQNLQSKLETEAYKGNVELITKLLEYMRPLNVFTNRSSVWQLADLAQRRRAKYQKAEKAFEEQNAVENADYKIEFDENEDRVKIYFNGIPSENIRTFLKQHNFRWSPRNKAWQRQITVDSRRVVNQFNSMMKSGELSGLGKPTIKLEFNDNNELLRLFDTDDISGVSKPAAIFNCPESALNCKGFSPTYVKLDSYDNLIDKAQGNKTLVGYGFANATLDELNNACKNYMQVYKLAQHLKADNYLQSAFNVWHFLHVNIRYNYDTAGQEEIRTPARTWADRFSGVDCDCLSVFTACLLYCMGYMPTFEIVGFKNDGVYSHIFVNLYGSAIDRVLPTFLERPPLITITKIMEIPVFELNGGNDISANSELNGVYASTLAKVKNHTATTDESVNLRKMQTLVSLQNSDNNAYKFASLIMPFVAVIDDNGAYYFNNAEIADAAEKADKQLYEYKLNNTDENTINKYFASIAKTFKNISVIVKKSQNKTSVSVIINNAANDTVRVDGDLIKKDLITINPSFIAMKKALMGLLAVNFLGIATRYYVGLLSQEDAANAGYSEDSWLESQKALTLLMRFWQLVSGDSEQLLQVIENGAVKTPLIENIDLNAKIVETSDNNATLNGYSFTCLNGVNGLGEEITLDSALKELGATLDNIWKWCEKVEPETAKEIRESLQNSTVVNTTNTTEQPTSEQPTSALDVKPFYYVAQQQPQKQGISDNLLWAVVGSLSVISIAALSNNKTKK